MQPDPFQAELRIQIYRHVSDYRSSRRRHPGRSLETPVCVEEASLFICSISLLIQKPYDTGSNVADLKPNLAKGRFYPARSHRLVSSDRISITSTSSMRKLILDAADCVQMQALFVG